MNALKSYDLFDDFNAISTISKWVKESYPDYTPENKDFLPIWKDIVTFEYPTAEGRKGFTSAKTLNDKIIGNQQIEILIIDSPKTGPGLHEQAGGITVPAGTILFLNDIELLRIQLMQVDGCFRSGCITPIYASLGQEHWVWIVTKSFNFNQPWVKKCYKNVAYDPTTANDIILQQTKLDLNFVASGLTGDEKRAVEHWIDSVFSRWEKSFNGDWDRNWQSLANLADKGF